MVMASSLLLLSLCSFSGRGGGQAATQGHRQSAGTPATVGAHQVGTLVHGSSLEVVDRAQVTLFFLCPARGGHPMEGTPGGLTVA